MAVVLGSTCGCGCVMYDAHMCMCICVYINKTVHMYIECMHRVLSDVWGVLLRTSEWWCWGLHMNVDV